jgi:hypothetical protein
MPMKGKAPAAQPPEQQHPARQEEQEEEEEQRVYAGRVQEQEDERQGYEQEGQEKEELQYGRQDQGGHAAAAALAPAPAAPSMDAMAKKELEDMLLRLERHYKLEQAARRAAEQELEALRQQLSGQHGEMQAQKSSVEQVGGGRRGCAARSLQAGAQAASRTASRTAQGA